MALTFCINKKYDLQFSGFWFKKSEIESEYKTLNRYLKYSCVEYQKSWDEIDVKFSKYIEKVTGYNWYYNSYECVISPVHQGISNWGNGNKIVRWWKENAYAQRRITAHELIVSHYFEIYRHNYSDAGLNDNQVWSLAEIAAFALTSLTPEAQSFWPWDKSGYYTHHNYPQLVELQMKLKNKFLKRKNFDEYIKTGIKLVKDLDISPDRK